MTENEQICMEPVIPDSDKILKDRARQLARKKETKQETGPGIDVVEFRLSDEHYGIELSFIEEVVLLKQLTVLPGLPKFAAGITSIRGKIYSVIDLKPFFDLPDHNCDDPLWLIVLSSKDMEFGIIADGIIRTRTVQKSMIHTSVTTLTEIREKYLKGVTKDSMAVLDAETILNDESLIIKE